MATSTYAGITQEGRTFYVGVLIKRLIPYLPFLKDGQKQTIPKHMGNVVQFRKYAVLSLANAKPGAVSTGCLNVSYTGTLPANVKLYGTGGGTGLNQYLNLVVTRGTFTGTPPAGSCTGFTADSTNYITQGAGVMVGAGR